MRRRRGIEDLRESYFRSTGPSFATRYPYPPISPYSSGNSYTTSSSTSGDYAPRWRRPSTRPDGQFGADTPPWFTSVCVQTVEQLQEAAAEAYPGRRASRRSHRTALIVPDLDNRVARSVSWRSAGPLIVCFCVRRYDYDADLRFDDHLAWRRIRQLASEKGADGIEREVRGMEGRLLVSWVVKKHGRIIDPRSEFRGSGNNAHERRRDRRDAVSAGLSAIMTGPYQYTRDYEIINEPNPLAYLFLPNPYKLPPRR